MGTLRIALDRSGGTWKASPLRSFGSFLVVRSPVQADKVHGMHFCRLCMWGCEYWNMIKGATPCQGMARATLSGAASAVEGPQ